MTNPYQHHDYHAMFVSFFHGMERQSKAADYKQFLDLIGGSFNPLTIHPNDVELGSKGKGMQHQANEIAYLVIGMFEFRLVMSQLNGGWRHNQGRVAASDPCCSMYMQTDLGHYAGSIGFTFSTKENLVLFDYREPPENFKEFFKLLYAPIRRETATAIRGHQKYLANTAKYDNIANILKIKVK